MVLAKGRRRSLVAAGVILHHLAIVLARDAVEPTAACGSGQYITYSGALEGLFTYASPDVETCGDARTHYFYASDDTTLRVGVNPAWDPNPFYFELRRDGPVIIGEAANIADLERPERGQRPLAGWQAGRPSADVTSDLRFQSAYHISTGEGRGCPADKHRSTAQVLDLTKANVTLVSGRRLGATDTGPYYVLRGDQSSHVAGPNSPSMNSFSIRGPANYHHSRPTADPRCAWPTLRWAWEGPATPFAYALEFSNESARAALAIADASLGTVELSFSGARVVDTRSGHPDEAGAAILNDASAESRRRRPAGVVLADPAEHPRWPHFLFADGSEILFRGAGADAEAEVAEDKADADDGAGSTSLAPGWKPPAAGWIESRMGVWLGCVLFTVAWVVLLC